MTEKGRNMMKQSLFIVVGAAALLALTAPVSAIDLCDDFGATWNVSVSPCSEAAGGQCVDGQRLSPGLAPCGITGNGDFDVHGAFANQVVSMASLDTLTDNCVAVHWTCNTGGGCSGVWHNEGLGSGNFTLSPGACFGPGTDADPQADASSAPDTNE